MAWTIELSERAVKALDKIDKATAKRIVSYLQQLTDLPHPTDRGKALTGTLAGLWRYRVGDWRIICHIDHEQVTIVALDIDHRSRIYRH